MLDNYMKRRNVRNNRLFFLKSIKYCMYECQLKINYPKLFDNKLLKNLKNKIFKNTIVQDINFLENYFTNSSIKNEAN